LYRFDSDVVATISARKNITLFNDNSKNHISKTIIILTHQIDSYPDRYYVS